MLLRDLALEHGRLGGAAFRAMHDAPVLVYDGDRDTEEAAGFHTHLAPRSTTGSVPPAGPRSPEVFVVKKRPGGPFEDRIGLGRARNADVHVPLQQLSKYHCYFVLEPELAIADAGSKNGTFVDGARLEPRQLVALRDGAEIQLGPYVFRFHTADGLAKLASRGR